MQDSQVKYYAVEIIYRRDQHVPLILGYLGPGRVSTLRVKLFDTPPDLRAGWQVFGTNETRQPVEFREDVYFRPCPKFWKIEGRY